MSIELRPDSKPVYDAAVQGNGCKMEAALRAIPMKDWEDVLNNVNSVFQQSKREADPSLGLTNLYINAGHILKNESGREVTDPDKVGIVVDYSPTSPGPKVSTSTIVSEIADIKNNKILGPGDPAFIYHMLLATGNNPLDPNWVKTTCFNDTRPK